MGAASPGAAQKAPGRGKSEACLRAVETRRVTARSRSAERLPRSGMPVRRHRGCALHGNLFPRRSHRDASARPHPAAGRTRAIGPRPLRARSWQQALGAACLLQPRGAMAKPCRGQTELWPKAGRVVRCGGLEAGVAWFRQSGVNRRFTGKTLNRAAGATCQGAPLPCRAATAIPARNPGPADPICRTVP